MKKLLLVGLLAAAAALAQTPSLEAAVAAYRRGDLTQARSAFMQLSAKGVPAADYNLAMMHLRARDAGGRATPKRCA